MILKWFFDYLYILVSNFQRSVGECSIHSCSCPSYLVVQYIFAIAVFMFYTGTLQYLLKLTNALRFYGKKINAKFSRFLISIWMAQRIHLLFSEFLSCQSEKKEDFSRQLETDAIWLCTKVVSIVYERRKVHDRDIGWHYLGLGVLLIGWIWLQLWHGSVVAWHFNWFSSADWRIKISNDLASTQLVFRALK